MKVNWEELARDLGSLGTDDSNNRHESGSRELGQKCLEKLIGAEMFIDAVHHYVNRKPGSELARSVLWLLKPKAATLECLEIYSQKSNPIEIRRTAVELLRILADRTALDWIGLFLDDPDAEIQIWGAGILDQLIFSNGVEIDECNILLEKMREHTNEQVRVIFFDISQQ